MCRFRQLHGGAATRQDGDKGGKDGDDEGRDRFERPRHPLLADEHDSSSHREHEQIDEDAPATRPERLAGSLDGGAVIGESPVRWTGYSGITSSRRPDTQSATFPQSVEIAVRRPTRTRHPPSGVLDYRLIRPFPYGIFNARECRSASLISISG